MRSLLSIITVAFIGFTTAVQPDIRDDFPTIPKKVDRRVYREAPSRNLRNVKRALSGNKQFSTNFQKKIARKKLRRHLVNLQKISDAQGGNRAAGSNGFRKSLEYVTKQLEAVGYEVSYSETKFEHFEVLSPPKIEAPARVDYTTPPNKPETYYVFPGSSSGTVRAAVTAVNVRFRSSAGPSKSTSGCNRNEFNGFPAGNIALLQRGGCDLVTKYQNAADAGASAVIVTNEGNRNRPKRTDAFTLSGAGEDFGVPTLFASSWFGVSLMEAMSAGKVVLTVKTDVINEVGSDMSILVETDAGDPSHVVMVGAHVDSVPAGPGINDDGTGLAAVLEMALQLKKNNWDNSNTIKNKIRFAFWACEEIGLLGSTQYVEGLSDKEINNIEMYINLDMIGSKNFVRWIEDGDGSVMNHNMPLHYGMAQLEHTLLDWFDSAGLKVESNPVPWMYGSSDHAPFYDAGIPTNFLHTGADELKSRGEKKLFGGTKGKPLDPCYHDSCDNINNVNLVVMQQMARATVHALAMFGSDEAYFLSWD